MKSLAIALALAAAPLAADCFAWEFGMRMGYRWDDLDNQIFDIGTSGQASSKESFQNMSTAQVSGFTKLRIWWFEAGVDADYGWTVGGHVKSSPSINPSMGENIQTTFKSCASGEVWDAYFTGGIRVPIWDCCDRSFFVTPLGGYSYNGIHEKRRNTSPSFIDFGPFTPLDSDPTFVSAPDTGPLKRDYQGPFAGVSMTINYCRFYTSFGYAYHWIDLHQQLNWSQQIEFYTPVLVINAKLDFENTFKTCRNRGNRGWLSLNYQDPCGWRVGLYGTYFATTTQKKQSKTITDFSLTIQPDTLRTVLKSTNPAKSRWRTFTVMLEGAYEF